MDHDTITLKLAEKSMAEIIKEIKRCGLQPWDVLDAHQLWEVANFSAYLDDWRDDLEEKEHVIYVESSKLWLAKIEVKLQKAYVKHLKKERKFLEKFIDMEGSDDANEAMALLNS